MGRRWAPPRITLFLVRSRRPAGAEVTLQGDVLHELGELCPAPRRRGDGPAITWGLDYKVGGAVCPPSAADRAGTDAPPSPFPFPSPPGGRRGRMLPALHRARGECGSEACRLSRAGLGGGVRGAFLSLFEKSKFHRQPHCEQQPTPSSLLAEWVQGGQFLRRGTAPTTRQKSGAGAVYAGSPSCGPRAWPSPAPIGPRAAPGPPPQDPGRRSSGALRPRQSGADWRGGGAAREAEICWTRRRCSGASAR